MYFGHLAHCTNYVALCVIHMAHCVTRGCPSLSLVGSNLHPLFSLVGVRRTRACESRFSFLTSSSGTPTSALYRAGNLVLSAPHRGPDPGLCLSHPNTCTVNNCRQRNNSPPVVLLFVLVRKGLVQKRPTADPTIKDKRKNCEFWLSRSFYGRLILTLTVTVVFVAKTNRDTFVKKMM